MILPIHLMNDQLDLEPAVVTQGIPPQRHILRHCKANAFHPHVPAPRLGVGRDGEHLDASGLLLPVRAHLKEVSATAVEEKLTTPMRVPEPKFPLPLPSSVAC